MRALGCKTLTDADRLLHSTKMIRQCDENDFDEIHAIVNDGAQAYKGIIPADRWPPNRWSAPYMPREKLRHEIDSGVGFWGYDDAGTLAGVMGIQHVEDVTLIRHAYVRTSHQRRGVGALLLAHLRHLTHDPVLIGTWADAVWAIRFYQRHGFALVPSATKDRLLRQYWSIPARQVETSVVLADQRWRELNPDQELEFTI